MLKTTKYTGNIGESIARSYLENQGFEFVGANFHTRYGEIDLIMRRRSDIYFFEVKYRKNMNYGYGEESISLKKIERLQKSINIWINKNARSAKYENVFLNALVIDSDRSVNVFEIM